MRRYVLKRWREIWIFLFEPEHDVGPAERGGGGDDPLERPVDNGVNNAATLLWISC